MNVHELKEKFMQKKQYAVESLNELLVFAKQAYIRNEINVNEYRSIVRELESQKSITSAE
ncbi:YppF family protein [Bacillus chungangensis]|uniref:YppF-like protein n=1 Tax=Bacillus chungangensis TaxID=587633 RepID=A0ABT9WTT7_9BACI|nr:YppF family protein [Bacillus chungangensis]MDQ0176160.1 hypothetical protein [Bacillus chungangensis]